MMNNSFKTEKIKGLTEDQVKQKLASEGFNELPSSKPKSLLKIESISLTTKIFCSG